MLRRLGAGGHGVLRLLLSAVTWLNPHAVRGRSDGGVIKKGIFFCEFLEMVEGTFSPALADAIIADSALAADGAYTAGGRPETRP